MSPTRRTALALTSACAVATGITSAARIRRRRRRDFRVFILEYHEVTADGVEREGTISQERLRRHLSFLKRRYRLTTLRRAAALLDGRGSLSEDLVVVTFDDGYAGNFEAAWPVLAEEDVPATVFLTTGFLDGTELWVDFARRGLRAADRSPTALADDLQQLLAETLGRWPPKGPAERGVERLKYLPLAQRDRLLEALREARLSLEPAAQPMSWEQVRQMLAGGVEMAGHTLAHPLLSTLPPELQEAEIRGCRQRIAEETGEAPVTFAFPNGDYDATTLQILKGLGFTAACTTRKGSNRPGCDLLTLRRIGVGSDPTWVLSARLSGLFDDEVRRWLRLDSRRDESR